MPRSHSNDAHHWKGRPAEDRFLARRPDTRAWVPVRFYLHPTGERYVHLGVRTTSKVA